MMPPTPARRPYLRPMAGWWRRNPFFVRYMARELTAFAVLAYSVVLMVGVVRLSQGEAAFNGWLQALRSPGSLIAHAIILGSMVVHSKSWFEIMPKTMPMMFVGGRRIAGVTITRLGFAATAATTVLLLALAIGWAP